jgi:formylglycine-generating enzyme required for sulfatase activity
MMFLTTRNQTKYIEHKPQTVMKSNLIIIATLAVAAFTACGEGSETGTKTETDMWRITATDDGHGTATATVGGKVVTQSGANKEITLTATPATGYLFGMWMVVGGGVELPDPAANPATFTMPEGDVEIRAVFRLPYEPEMVFVKSGTFMMGSDKPLADPDEQPVHQVTLTTGYWIGKYEVTQAQWYAVMDKAGDVSPARFTGDNLPIENVRYAEAQEYIAKLNAATGKKYTLPTEAQWEFAARGGNKSQGYTFSGGNTVYLVAWYNANSEDSTRAVGTRHPNELGIYDMSGNVWEWTADWFYLYTAAAQTDPTGPDSPLSDPEHPTYAARVYRGGCFDNSARHCWPSNRGIISPDDLTGDLGLRLALVP